MALPAEVYEYNRDARIIDRFLSMLGYCIQCVFVCVAGDEIKRLLIFLGGREHALQIVLRSSSEIR